MIRALVVSVAVLAAGCAAPQQTERDLYHMAENAEDSAMSAGMNQGHDTCGMAAFQNLIGKPASEIDRSKLPPRARVIMPGQMVTMDFSAQRLNIRVAPDGKVASLGCF